MEIPKSYLFFFPYRGVGGVPILFLRLAHWIVENTNHDVYLIDYADGFMAKTHKNSKIHFIEYTVNAQVSIPSNAILVFQSDLPWGLPKNLIVDDSVTAFFWNCYPYNLIPVLPGKAREWMSESLIKIKLVLNTVLFSAKNQCRNFLIELTKHHSIAFMDLPNLQMTEKALGIRIHDPVYLPIPVPGIEAKSTRSFTSESTLSGAWVGRLADFKIYSLAYTLQEIQKWCDQYKVYFDFYVIGDGDRIFELQSMLHESEYLKIHFLGSMNSKELEMFLTTKVDILFAMGTSALEGARLEIPTVLLDFSYNKFPSNYKFNWIYNTSFYSLGAPIDLVKLSLGDKIDIIFENIKNKSSVAKECRKYFEDHHDINHIAPLFMDLSKKSTFRYGEFLNSHLNKKPGYYRLWKFLKSNFLKF